MALNQNERALLEAVSGLLSQDALGMQYKNDKETSHTSQFRWEGIDDAFALKVSDSPFFESMTSAFYAVHAHKYIDHPTFKLALVSELKSRAVPQVAIEEAVKVLDGIINELSAKKPSERDAGWNPQIAEIADMTRNADTRKMTRPEPFTGGGPWVEAMDKDFHDLLISEGVISESDEIALPITAVYRRLKSMGWSTAKQHMVKLAEDAHEVGLTSLAKNIEQHIRKQDNLAVSKLIKS